MDKNAKNMLGEIISDLKSYFLLQKEYWKLDLIEKIALTTSFILITLICIFAFFFATIYFSIALIFLLKSCLGSIIPALFIVSGFYLLIIVLTLIFRERLFINPMIRLVNKLFR